jgi:hypothetical protein
VSKPDLSYFINDNSTSESELVEYLYVISGYCDSPLGSVERIILKRIEGVSGFEERQWQKMPDLPTPRTKFQSVVVPKFIFNQNEPPVPCIMAIGGKNRDS